MESGVYQSRRPVRLQVCYPHCYQAHSPKLTESARWSFLLFQDGVSSACSFPPSMVHGIFPDQGSNLCPLHWQVDSELLGHQGSPQPIIYGSNSQENFQAIILRVKTSMWLKCNTEYLSTVHVLSEDCKFFLLQIKQNQLQQPWIEYTHS